MPTKPSLVALALILILSSERSGAEPPKAAATGTLHLRLSERSPLSATNDVVSRALGDDRPANAEEMSRWGYDLGSESFEAFVPPTYKPDVPFGLFVFVSAGDVQVSPAWLALFQRHKLIWICAN